MRAIESVVLGALVSVACDGSGDGDHLHEWHDVTDVPPGLVELPGPPADLCAADQIVTWDGSAWGCAAEKDPKVGALTAGRWCSSDGTRITCSETPPISALETDPVFAASAAAAINTGDVTNWNTAYGWGDHATAGYLTSESDPAFVASAAAGIQPSHITNWNTAYGWGDHATAGYLTSESDPAFGASAAASIQASNISNWNTAYAWGNHATAGYITSEADPQVGTTTSGSVCVGTGTGLNCSTAMSSSEVGDAIVRRDPAGDFAAGSITASGGYLYAAPRTHTISISATAFTGGSTSFVAVDHGSATGPMRRYVATAGTGVYLVAPVQIPNGAAIKEWKCKVFDNSLTYDVSMGMYYVRYSSTAELLMWGTSSTTSIPGLAELTSGPVNFFADPDNMYYLRFTPTDGACGTACQIYGCQVVYQVSEAD